MASCTEQIVPILPQHKTRALKKNISRDLAYTDFQTPRSHNSCITRQPSWAELLLKANRRDIKTLTVNSYTNLHTIKIHFDYLLLIRKPRYKFLKSSSISSFHCSEKLLPSAWLPFTHIIPLVLLMENKEQVCCCSILSLSSP